MKCPKIYHILLFIFLLACDVRSCDALRAILGPHRIGLGPEIYFLQRSKDGGSKQHGFMYGGRAVYEHFRGNNLYWAAEGYWAYGSLRGHNADTKEIHSDKSDAEIEGRLGYTFMKEICNYFWLTPFLGGGYFVGSNRFIKPSPMRFESNTAFPFVSLGFLSRVELANCFYLGLNFKTKYPIGAKCKITNDPDPEVDNSTLIIEDKFFYEVELPFIFHWRWQCRRVECSFVPFYRMRHYGGHENHPYDFIDTKYHSTGARLIFSLPF